MSWRQIVSYGVGDFAFCLSFQLCSLYLLYYYTDIVGLPASTAGMIIMVALVWEGVSDPLVGVIANRTRSRWGRYRPYILFGTIPLTLSVIAMFYPVALTGSWLVAYCFATHIIYRTLFTFVQVPFVSLSAQITRDSEVRGQIAGVRMMFAILCGLLIAAVTLPFAGLLGGGREGFFVVTLIYAGIAAIILFFCFATTREPGELETGPAVSLAEMLRSLAGNRPFLMLLVATIVGATGYTMAGKALVYYMKYWVGSEAAVTLGLVLLLTSAALALIPWMMISRRTSKRFVWLAGVGVNMCAYALLLLFAPREGAALWLLIILTGIGNSAFVLTFWSMLPDTVELGEWQSRVRSEGAVVGMISFAQKVAFGLGTGMIGIFLDLSGYVANVPQSDAALRSIVLLYAAGPLLLFAASAIAIWAYPIDHRLHSRLVRGLEWRHRRRGAPDVS
ncbi:glycoside-pentoside-hexuronide (GPH):cation symporter [Sphingopyxis sp.]|jgi:GPH family glycoside/pentoside/hexuronide:cation symporter|uniref:MFS transporter n=1 Tax=Sphingopyxis sp. TaxID=1908224 RepID=UPI002DE3C711|nr:glycoside-pentoside-hexuronide (GPH):cation symporter [Sphingopyxis sp.]